MTQKQFLGMVRELTTAGAGLLGFYAVLNGSQGQAVIALAVALASLLWGLWQKTPGDWWLSSLRKVLSAGAGVAIGFGLATDQQVEAWMAAVIPVLTVLSSAFSNRDDDHPRSKRRGSSSYLPTLLFLCVLGAMASGLTSCSSFQAEPGASVRGPVSGLRYEADESGRVTTNVDAVTAAGWAHSLTRVLRGEDWRRVILPQK